MKKMKWLTLALVVVLMLGSLPGCAKKATTTEEAVATTTETTETTTETVAAPVEKKDIQFYGKIVEYASGEPMTNELQKMLADKYNIEALQVDWGNLNTVIRTAIAAGNPCDVYEYWPQAIKTFVDSEMALDLTPYLDANGGEWRNQFVESALNTGVVNGKNYAVPINSNFSLMVANKALLDANNIVIPENWNWDQFLEVCKQLKAAGIFPVGQNTDNGQGDWFLRNGMLCLASESGKLEALTNADVPTTDPVFTTAFTNVKGLYDNAYMFPGEGAVTVKRDEIKAGFYQGKIAIIGDIASGVSATLKEAPFETVLIPWPTMGTKAAVLGGCDGVFIPSNVKDPEASVEVLKAYTSAQVQKIHADAGFPIVNKNVEITDPITKSVVAMSTSVYPFEFQNFNAMLNDYMSNNAIGELVLGGGVEATLKALEDIRLEVKQQ